MRQILFATTATALFAATTAMASGPAPAPVEPPVAQPAPPPAFNWTGPYAGIQLGMLNSNFDRQTEYYGFTTPETNPDPEGFVGGIYGGYNWQGAGNVVYGIEGEYNWSHADGSDVDEESGFGSYTEAEIFSTAALRGRVGYAMDRTLFYGAAGIAYADFDSAAYNSDDSLVANSEISDSRTGWTIGAGVEHAFTDRMVGRLDYRYSDFGDETYDLDENYTADIDFDTHEIRAGVAFRF
ncbi:hypothetical protein C2I36_01410 [Rhodobacteraceae bacterium WD3A24]|nr:hypothetical protein C2I36_01410 [Rhodobacteraceae bacterium WD3A24]